MAKRDLEFAGVNIEEDTIYIPFLTQIFKELHVYFPTLFHPFILKTMFIFGIIPLLIMWCLAWSNRKCHGNLTEN